MEEFCDNPDCEECFSMEKINNGHMLHVSVDCAADFVTFVCFTCDTWRSVWYAKVVETVGNELFAIEQEHCKEAPVLN